MMFFPMIKDRLYAQEYIRPFHIAKLTACAIEGYGLMHGIGPYSSCDRNIRLYACVTLVTNKKI